VVFSPSFSTVRRNRELLCEKENFCEVQKIKIKYATGMRGGNGMELL
jgi:hypothetical protein